MRGREGGRLEHGWMQNSNIKRRIFFPFTNTIYGIAAVTKSIRQSFFFYIQYQVFTITVIAYFLQS